MSDLDKAKLVTGSDGETARQLGISKHKISDVRAGRCNLTPYQSAKLAEIIGERWHDAALARMAELAASEEERHFWRGKLQTLAKIAQTGALAVFLIIGGVFLSPSGNAEASNLSVDKPMNELFIAHLMYVAAGESVSERSSEPSPQGAAQEDFAASMMKNAGPS